MKAVLPLSNASFTEWQNIINFQIPQNIEGNNSASKSAVWESLLHCFARHYITVKTLKAAAAKLVRSQILMLLQLAISMIILEGIISKLCMACCLFL